MRSDCYNYCCSVDFVLWVSYVLFSPSPSRSNHHFLVFILTPKTWSLLHRIAEVVMNARVKVQRYFVYIITLFSSPRGSFYFSIKIKKKLFFFFIFFFSSNVKNSLKSFDVLKKKKSSRYLKSIFIIIKLLNKRNLLLEWFIIL